MLTYSLPQQPLDIHSLYQGFLFGVRVGNSINGNTVDIDIKQIAAKLDEIASRQTTIISTGAELKQQFNGFTVPEHVLRDLVDRDQHLATALLRAVQEHYPHMGQENNPS